MRSTSRVGFAAACFAILMMGCGRPTPAPTLAETPTSPPLVSPTEQATQVAEAPIYLAIIWHQHQPVYFKDPETGIYIRPWVRVHATKDYVDMASILKGYPDVHVTFNLTPSLIRQLDDLAAGAKDLYWVYAEVPAAELTEQQKRFILDRFFDTNRRIINRFPRYRELLDRRDGSPDPLGEFQTQDYLDLQILFNLAWTDPDWLAHEPLASLEAQGRDFNEGDKAILFAEHLRLIRDVIPAHRDLQDAGQIEVTMTPFAHPILPLLVNTDLARVALPGLELPGLQFVYGQDAVAQVELGVQLYEEHFGRPPRGMWPAEGAVAQEIVTMVAQNGIRWMASDEGVLARSLGLEAFTRDAAEVVVEADQLYRPYYVEGQRGGPVGIVFRDVVISDKVGFTYSGLPGSVAAADFIQRIHAIRERLNESGATGPHLVSVILDGENAWEHYENDGKEFLHSLYQRLSEDSLIITVTPSEFLEIAPDQPRIERLWAGSWINHDFSTWIGEEEENTAWEYLARARETLQSYITGARRGQVGDEALNEALTQMYIAEGSDWFWWYGADQNSGDDGSFDQQFRDTLKRVYRALGETPPSHLDVPIIPEQAAEAARPSSDLLTPEVDGVLDEGEWGAAGLYQASGGAMAAAEPFFEHLVYGFDGRNLYLGIKVREGFVFPAGEARLEIYLKTPGGGPANSFSAAGSLLGFPASRLVALTIIDGLLTDAEFAVAAGEERWQPVSALKTLGPGRLELDIMIGDQSEAAPVAMGQRQIEVGLPLTALAGADSGDRLTLRAVFSQQLSAEAARTRVDVDRIPGAGPALVNVPDLGTTAIVLDVADPEGDDYGPGTYTYPLDPVFTAGNFDVVNFQVGLDAENVVFRFSLRGPVDNPWGSPNGLSVQTFDVYIDADGDNVGGEALLPGRNLSLAEGFRWDFAITAEGWTPAIYAPGQQGPVQIAGSSEFTILVDPGQRKVTLRVPKSVLGEDPRGWRIAAMVLSQEGFPSTGVMRVRDVAPIAEQWRIGGAPPGTTNHTRVLDLVWPTPGEQETWLGDFSPTALPQAELAPADFARISLLNVE